jgi:1-acyl-sn-glycerol-3-phosphate acyltransferase
MSQNRLNHLVKEIDKLEEIDDHVQREKLKRQYWKTLHMLCYDDPNLVVSDEISEKLDARSDAQPQNPVIALMRSIGIFCAIFVTFPWVMLFSVTKYFDPYFYKMGLTRNQIPTSWVVYVWCKLMLFISGVKLYTVGKENIATLYREGTQTIGMYQHSSNLDSFLLGGGCGLRYKFIAKKSIGMIPIVGWMFSYVDNMFSIDRENRENAIAVIDRAGDEIRDKKVSVAISPEGTRSKNGQINDFKMGAFHLAKKAMVPVVPILIAGANRLWPHGQLFPSEGAAAVRILEPVFPDEFDKWEVHEFRDRIRKLMLEKNTEDINIDMEPPGIIHKILSLMTTLAMYILFYYHLKYLVFVPLWWISQLF